MLQKFLEKINQTKNASIQNVLLKLFSLYGLYNMEKFMNILYQGGFITGEAPALLIQDSITELCASLKDEAVSLVDAIAPPDSILNSVLGASDGQVIWLMFLIIYFTDYDNLFQVYHHLQNSFLTSPYGVGKPTWWTDIVNWKDIAKPKRSKL